MSPTGLLLLQGELSPVLLHAVSQRHPELGLLGVGHTLPPLLNVGKGRVRDGVGGGGSPRDYGSGSSSRSSSNARPQERRSRCAHHRE